MQNSEGNGFGGPWQILSSTFLKSSVFCYVELTLKLDELIKATARARNSIIDVGNLSDEQLKRLEEEYQKLCTQVANAPGRKGEKKS